MHTALAVPLGMVGAASAWTVKLAQSAPFAEDSNWILQASGIGLVISVAFWLIQRSDKREASQGELHSVELKAEREAHEITRTELKKALRDLAHLETLVHKEHYEEE